MKIRNGSKEYRIGDKLRQNSVHYKLQKKRDVNQIKIKGHVYT